MYGQSATLIQLWRKMIGISFFIGVVVGLSFLPSGAAILIGLFTAFCAFATLGNFWMMYAALVREKHPWPMIVLAAFVPFAGLWYYFSRVRPGRVATH
jgi:uncharacterized membrane protein YphA (DoxX/SURF4 family)